MSIDQPTIQARSKSIPWLRLARMGWYLAAAVSVGIFIASIRGYILFAPLGFAASQQFAFNPAPFVITLNVIAGVLSISIALFSLCLALVLFRRRPADRMALFLSYFLLAYGIVVAGPLEFLQPLLDRFASQLILVFTLLISIPLFFFLFALFPDGRFVPRWTRWLGLASVLLVPVILFVFPASSLYFSGTPPLMPFVIGQVLIFMFFAGILYSQIFRYRYVSTSQQKQQTKWVVYGFGLMLTLLAISSLPWTWLNSLPQGTPFPAWGAIASVIYILSFAFIPVTLTIAVMRYRLFEIDFLINRSLVYGGLTAFVVSIYVLVVGALGAFFEAQGNLLIALLATGLVALLFQPLRERLQRGVNRLIYGERDDPIEALTSLGKRLESAIPPGEVLPTLVETIAQTLKLPYVAILLPAESGDQLAVAHGQPSSPPVSLLLTYQGQTIGQLAVVPHYPDQSFSPSEMRLLRDLARQAGAAVHAVRLTGDLQRSRQRLVTAREEERRRLRRDLHDGLGPTLAALHVQANALRRLIHTDPHAAQGMVTEFDDEIREAIDDIRRVVYDLRPPTLDELGLVGAARAYAAHCSRQVYQQAGQDSDQPSGEEALSIQVEAPEELPPLSAAIEVAAYHVIREALTNVVHHAQASSCVVHLRVTDALTVEIADDGIGLPREIHTGVGLLSMRERAEELGGTFTVEPGQGGGTRVMARFPLLEV
jgi:signal transduction histidine kinase